MIAAARIAEVFVEVADTLVDDFDVIEFLEQLTRYAAELSAAASAGLLLADPHGQLQFIASSATSVKLLELFQLQNQQGPGVDCFRTGEAVVNTDLHQADDRWPLFAPRAVDAGFQLVHAFPLRHRLRVIGALNLFSSDTGRLEPNDIRIIQGLADVATIGLMQERSIRAENLTEQLQSALDSKVAIEQAKGVLTRAHAISVDDAFELLCEYSRRNHLRLSDVARAVVSDPTLAGLPTGDSIVRGSVADADRVGAMTPRGVLAGSGTTEATWRGGPWDGVIMTVVTGERFFPMYDAVPAEGANTTGPGTDAKPKPHPHKLCPIVPGQHGGLIIDWDARVLAP